MQQIGSNASEVDHKQQHEVHVSQQMFICGQDQPDDQPEHTLDLS